MEVKRLGMLIVLGLLAGCGSGGEDGVIDPAPAPNGNQPPVAGDPPGDGLDAELRMLIAEQDLTGDPSLGRTLPTIDEPLAQLGMKLFFSKSLGGQFDSACVSCHHPVLGGADDLSLSVGVDAIDPDLLGAGRQTPAGSPNVPRNAPTTFNVGLWDTALFFDSRVESFGKEAGQNGAASGISTPDSGAGALDPNAGANLTVAQARFPVTSVEEMRADFAAGESNEALRTHLAARIGDYGLGAGEIAGNGWLAEFQTAFVSAEPAESLITFDNIALALAEYERSQVFVDSPWRAYVQGDNDAISDAAKEGAVLFFTPANEGGASCSECHSGDLFSDGEHHAIGAPQFGPGKGNPNDNDFGRENVTGNPNERFRFRTPSLLNVAVTAPYMHTGAYETLGAVLQHYNNPDDTVDDFFDDGGVCQLEQFEGLQNCQDLYPDARQNSLAALDKVDEEQDQNDPQALPNININQNERNQLEAFLRTLTDPCVESRACLASWIPAPNEAPDGHQLNAVSLNGNPL